ncbi:class I SAM-dependent methyltransferase [Methylobacterium goesingense]|uniref:SAM-dependent methyltransferase n=1 Tax=Methylobacterium goesingense TaxID=243690 RepID=A0ABV2LBE4_9HYPH|nr:class I SAM-dependent methyltransferase [Methylobacterium goesingense]GJD73189.1 Ubiquinone biosynthesis O-methyltransferase, mitochondrial [Methylobacterium goesingense]
MDALTLIRETFAPLPGRRLIDIGCGPGALAGALAGEGARVTGIDPNPAAITQAAGAVPGAGFAVASGAHLPFAEAAFDGAVFLNTLHHMPEAGAALREAVRVVAPGARIVVVEPLAEGSFFTALRPVEDETAVRRAAQATLDALVAAGELACERDVTFARSETFAGLDPFLARVLATDPARAGAIAERRAAIEAAFLAAASRDDQGRFVLVQPLRACILTGRFA